MKAISIFLILALIYAIYSDNACTDFTPEWSDIDGEHLPAYSLDFCRSTAFESNDYYTCCFLKWRDHNDTHRYNCYPVNHTEMADIDLATKYIESFQQIKDLKSLDCSSSYLYGSLLLILALLF